MDDFQLVARALQNFSQIIITRLNLIENHRSVLILLIQQDQIVSYFTELLNFIFTGSRMMAYCINRICHHRNIRNVLKAKAKSRSKLSLDLLDLMIIVELKRNKEMEKDQRTLFPSLRLMIIRYAV